MKIAILGATGWIGSTTMEEALSRGHKVIAISRDANSINRDDVEPRTFDLLSNNSLAKSVEDADLVIAAVGGRAKGNHDMVAKTAKRLLNELPEAGVERLIWVGGAGTLEVAPGVKLVTTPEFPPEYKPESIAQGEALDVFYDTSSPLEWLYVSPAAELFPGERTGNYRIGDNQFFVDTEGNSKISVQDYAAALLDEAEKAVHSLKHISVAY